MSDTKSVEAGPSRRQFLTAGAAALAMPFPASPQRPPPEPERVTMYRVVDARGWDRGVYPTREAVERQINEAWLKSDYEGCEIKPYVVTFSGERYRLGSTGRWFRNKWAPIHTLDLPPLDDHEEPDLRPDDYTSRAEVMRAASEENWEEIHDIENRPKYWALVVQVGDVIDLPSTIMCDREGPLGVDGHMICRPSRVVTPTLAEIEKYAKPIERET